MSLKIKLNRINKLVFMAPLLLEANECFAATATNTFQVLATVNDSCSVQATTLNFGAYSSGGAAVTADNTVSVTCNSGTGYTVALSAGAHSGGSFTPRLMANGANTLQYNIYTTPGLTSIWGDGTNSTVTQTGTGNGLAQTYTGYGQIPASQDVVGGGIQYSDQITVTVTYT